MTDREDEVLLGLYEETRQDLEKITSALDNLETLAPLCDQKMLKGIYQDNAERAKTHLEFIKKLIEMEEKLYQNGNQAPQSSSSSVKDTLVHFIIPNKDKQLEVNPEAVDMLESINQPMVIIAVAGLFRTGKSYILNRLAGQQRGFMLGPNVQSCTKGVWLWCTPITVKRDGVDARIVLLDTEGLGDSEKGDKNYDTSIFALAILLSSYFIYNSMRSIDEDALQALHLVGELASHVQVKSGQDETEEGREQEFPAFCWLVRDSELELPQGQTPKGHMEDILALKPGASKKIRNYNDPRAFIKQLFQSRECFLLRKPVENEELLRRVDQLPKSELHSEFVLQSDSFVKHVLDNVPIKKVLGKPITGIELGSLASNYVTAINNGAIPVISDAFHSLVEVQGTRAVILATTTYNDGMLRQIKDHGGLPLQQKNLSEFHERSMGEANMQLSRSCMQEIERFGQVFNDNVREIYERFDTDNTATSREVCKTCLNKNYQPIKEKLQNMDYLKNPDNYHEDVEVMVACFISETNGLPLSTEILNEFLGTEVEQDMMKLKGRIQAADARSKAIAQEKKVTGQVQSQLLGSQNLLRQTEEERKKQAEEQERQKQTMEQRQKDELKKTEAQNTAGLHRCERERREQTERQFADMQSSFSNTLRRHQDEASSQESARQQQIAQLQAQLGGLNSTRQNLHNQKY